MLGGLIGALKVSLGLDSASFNAGIAKSKGDLGKFALAATAALAAVSAAATGALLAIRGAADRADFDWKASQQVGVAVKDFGRLKYAAELSDVSIEQLKKGLQQTAVVIKETADGVENDATNALDGLGISAKNADGSLRSTTDVIGDVADRFARMPDGVTKTNLAIDLFGKKVGPDLIPLLNEGREGLKQMGDQAERLGLVFDAKTAAAAERFNDNMTRISLVLEGLWNRVLAGVIPAFEALSERIFNATQEGGALDGIVSGITIGMNILVKAIMLVLDHLQDLYDLFRIWVATRIVLYITSVAGALITLAKIVRVTGITMKLVTEITHAKITALVLLAAVVAKVTGQYENLVAWLEEVGNKVMDALPESVRSGLKDIGEMLTGFGEDLIVDADEKGAKSLRTALNVSEQAAASFGKLGDAATVSLEAARDPFSQWQMDLDALSAWLNKNPDEWATYAGAVQRATAGMVAGYADLAGSALDAFGQIFKGNKAIAVASAIVNGIGSVAKTLETYGVTPWGLAAAGVAATTAAANVASILSTTESSKSMPGGSRGAVTGAAAAPEQGAALTLTIKGSGFGSFDDFAKQLAEGLSDGGHPALAQQIKIVAAT